MGQARVSWVPQGRHSAAMWPCHPLTKLTGVGVGPDTPPGRVAPPRGAQYMEAAPCRGGRGGLQEGAGL